MAGSTVLITLPLDIRGQLQLKESVESNPCLTVYTDDHERTSVARLPLTDNWQRVELKVRVRGVTALAQCRTHLIKGAIYLYGVVSMKTDVGQTARKYAGSASIDIATLFLEPFQAHTLPLVVFFLSDSELKLTLPKGSVEIRAAGSVTINDRMWPLNITPAEARDFRTERDRQRRTRMRQLRGLISAWEYLFANAPQTFAAAQTINCYTLRLSDSTMLPSMAYMMQPTPDGTDVNFFENCLDIVLRRESMTRTQLVAVPADSRVLVNIAVQMLCMYCNYMPYVGDQAWVPLKTADDGGIWGRVRSNFSKQHIEMKHFPLEEFEVAELYGSDDCEGGGFFIIRMHQYLLSVKLSDLSPALAHVRALLELYVPTLLLCGVTSADLGGNFAALTADGVQMGAHMFAVFFPLGRLLRMIQRCNRKENPFPGVTLEFEMAAAKSANLPIVCGEGTGLLAPLPLDLPECKHLMLPPAVVSKAEVEMGFVNLSRPPAQMCRVKGIPTPDTRGMRPFTSQTGSFNPIFSNNSLFVTDLVQAVHQKALAGGVRKWYHITSREDVAAHFYRTAQLMITPSFGTMGFNLWSFVLMQRKRNSTAEWSVGCLFSDLFNENEDSAPREVCAWPETPPDAHEYEIMVDEMRRCPRPPVLRPPAAVLGENNTWDPTAPVPSPALHRQMEDQLTVLRTAALRAEINSMIHVIEYGGVRSVLGTPHLLSSCDCERKAAQKLIASDPELARKVGRGGLDGFIEQFRDVMSRTSMPNSEPDRRRAITAEFIFNYEQMQQRGSLLVDVVQTSIEIANAVILPAGLHADWEHVTADTGGVRVRLYTVVQY